MVKSPSEMLDEVIVGNDAGWNITFHEVNKNGEPGNQVLAIGRDDYYAAIDATMPHGLEGGVYRFVIERMLDDDYKKLAKKQAPYMKLYLFWRDNNQSVSGYLANVTGLQDVLKATNKVDPDTLVAVLMITDIVRKKGELSYDVHIEAREHVYHQLSSARLTKEDADPAATNRPLVDYVRQLVEAHHVTAAATPFEGAHFIVGGTLTEGTKVLATLGKLAERIEKEANRHGRGVYLIRDGKLYIGTREFPLKSGQTKDLTIAGGLVEIKPAPDPPDESASATHRKRYQLTLKGRPDIKPGGMVRVNLPPEEEDRNTLAGPLGVIGELASDVAKGAIVQPLGGFDASKATSLYVVSVRHQLSRQHGFVTSVIGLEVDPKNPWDQYKTSDDPGERARPDSGSGTGEGRAARAIDARLRTAMRLHWQTDVAQVRGMTSQADTSPLQTLTVHRGLDMDGGAHSSVRLTFGDTSTFDEVPYLTPFAWGKCGLVLPRYPGMRIALTHRLGQLDDPLDIGAVWESNSGPESKPGDYWLILPAAVPQDRRASIAEDDQPLTYAGAVTHDLIDADGNRVIEVGELMIRVGSLKDVDKRPARASDANSVTIEHAAGDARIIMKQDGSIVIQGKQIEIDAGSGNITMKAKKVDVQVTDSMDVT